MPNTSFGAEGFLPTVGALVVFPQAHHRADTSFPDDAIETLRRQLPAAIQNTIRHDPEVPLVEFPVAVEGHWTGCYHQKNSQGQ
jgi:hypothetical protein